MAAAVAFGLVVLWPEHRDVWYLNDASVHRSMTQWAADRIREGHLPFDGWYPYLSLGASRFHHYQSLPHIFTGALSVVLGAGHLPLVPLPPARRRGRSPCTRGRGSWGSAGGPPPPRR